MSRPSSAIPITKIAFELRQYERSDDRGLPEGTEHLSTGALRDARIIRCIPRQRRRHNSSHCRCFPHTGPALHNGSRFLPGAGRNQRLLHRHNGGTPTSGRAPADVWSADHCVPRSFRFPPIDTSCAVVGAASRSLLTPRPAPTSAIGLPRP